MSLYTFYIDDSYFNIKYSQEKHMVLGGLIIENSVEDGLIKELYELKQEFNLRNYDPIKFSPENKSEYTPQRAISNQNQFKERVLHLISSHGIDIISAYYHNTSKMDISKMTYQLMNDLLIRFQFYIKQKNSDYNDRGCIVLAFPGTKQTSIFSKKYHALKHHTAILHSKNYCSPSTRPIELSLLEESIYFSYEIHNPLIQLADFISGSMSFALKNNDDKFFKIIKNKFRNNKGNIKGYGLISYPHYTPIIDRLCR